MLYLKSSEEGITLPREVLKEMNSASGSDLEILIFLYSEIYKGEALEEAVVKDKLSEAGFTEEEILSAMAFWRGAKIIGTNPRGMKKSAPKKEHVIAFDPEKKPSYTSEELAHAVEEEKGFRELYNYTMVRLEKSLNNSELATLYSFVNYLCIPIDLIMLVMEYCIGEGKKSLRYVEKMLITMADEGIVSYESGEKYIKKLKDYSSFESKVRRIIGAGDRTLTKAEKSAVTKMQEIVGENFEVLETAYEKTIGAIGKVSLSYMSKIIESWSKDKEFAATGKIPEKKPQLNENKSYDVDDFFAAALNKKKKD